LLRPFKRVEIETGQRMAVVFRRQSLGLRRWMILNILTWALVVLGGLLNFLRGLSVQRSVGLSALAFGLEDALEPSTLFFSALIVLYVVRWHILWRAERLERDALRSA
jgi:hypothetical protein